MKTIIATVVLFVAAPAVAQSANDEKFSGFYVGNRIGWQQDEQAFEVTQDGVTTSLTNRSSGFAYGGNIGYDYGLSSKVVVGLAFGFSARTGSAEVDTDTSLSIGRTFTVITRLGYRVDSNSLFYTRGGYANTQFRLTSFDERATADRGGWTIGVGYERFLNRHIAARIEYDYSDFGREKLDAADTLGLGNVSVKLRRHQVGVGLNYHF